MAPFSFWKALSMSAVLVTVLGKENVKMLSLWSDLWAEGVP